MGSNAEEKIDELPDIRQYNREHPHSYSFGDGPVSMLQKERLAKRYKQSHKED